VLSRTSLESNMVALGVYTRLGAWVER
jgi:hypothetical protein